MVTEVYKGVCYIVFMPFIPTEKQVESLNILLKQLIREMVEVRLIRFMRLAESTIGNNIIEILCLEDHDRYYIYFDGRIDFKIR